MAVVIAIVDDRLISSPFGETVVFKLPAQRSYSAG